MGCMKRGKRQRNGHSAQPKQQEERKGQLLVADDLRTAASTSKAWPYEEARKLLKRWPDGKPDGAPMLFETG